MNLKSILISMLLLVLFGKTVNRINESNKIEKAFIKVNAGKVVVIDKTKTSIKVQGPTNGKIIEMKIPRNANPQIGEKWLIYYDGEVMIWEREAD